MHVLVLDALVLFLPIAIPALKIPVYSVLCFVLCLVLAWGLDWLKRGLGALFARKKV